ncbi:MAG TPA: hypothetical protein VF773_13275 [Verrucomicrobiae bacterium]
MRILVASVASALVAGALAYTLANRKDGDLSSRLAQEQARWAAEKAQLEADLQSAKRRPTVVTGPAGETVVVQQQLDPEEIIGKLKTLRASSRDPRSIRKVIYHLEQLREIGPDSLPPIRAFLARFEDVDYMGARQERTDRDGAEQSGNDRERGGRGGPRGDDMRERLREFRDGGGGRGGDARLTFVTPASLRMGLFDVVQGIGGAEAEEILANVMAETGRAVELAYVFNLLDEMAPKKYAATAIAAAKDLLMDPPQATGGNRLDENSKDYLYALLTKLGDTSFAANAQGMLVAANGQMDRRALNYLDETMKEQAMPAIYAAYNDPRLTNMMDKASLMNVALKHVGKNQQANELLNSVISDQSTPTAARAMAVASLTRGDLTPEEIRARIPVVEALRGSTTDERLQRALVATQQNLQNMLEGRPVDNSGMREVFRGGREGFAGGAAGGGFGGRRGGQRTQQGATNPQ